MACARTAAMVPISASATDANSLRSTLRLRSTFAKPSVVTNFSKTMDYAALHQRLVRVVATTSYALLEHLAGDLLEAVFVDPRVVRAKVTVSKPQILDGATPCVTLERESPRHEPA